jgi:DDE superfamily endonuclease
VHESIETAAPEVQGLVHRSPRLYDINQSMWTLTSIQQQIRWLHGLSISAVSKILKKLGARFKRGRASIHSPDLLYNQKMAKIQHAHLLNLLDSQRFPLLYEDEKTYYRRAEVGKTWGSRGNKGAKKVNQVGGTTGVSRIAGCIDVQTGKVISRQRSSFNVKEMYRFFYYVEQHYKEAERIFIVLDNWPVHFHEYVKENLARGAKKIVLLPLPTYAPWENPMEKVWLKFRKDVLLDHSFGTHWQELKEVAQQWLQDCHSDSEELLHFVGLEKKMEEYRSILARIQQQGQTQEVFDMADLLTA